MALNRWKCVEFVYPVVWQREPSSSPSSSGSYGGTLIAARLPSLSRRWGVNCAFETGELLVMGVEERGIAWVPNEVNPIHTRGVPFSVDSISIP